MDTSGIVNIRNHRDISFGTGFFVLPQYILTCKHVLTDAGYSGKNEEIYCQLSEPEYRFCARWIDESEELDLAILYFKGYKGKYYPLEQKFQPLMRYETYGFPNGENVIAYAKPSLDNYVFPNIQLGHANAITYGFSGAPLLNNREMVIGMVTDIVVTKENRRQEVAYAIASSVILDTFQKYLILENLISIRELYEKAMHIFGASMTESDAASAVLLFSQLADMGSEEALLFLSYIYRVGEKVELDLCKSVDFMERAMRLPEFDKTGKNWLDKGKAVWRDNKKAYEAVSYLVAAGEQLKFSNEINGEACNFTAKVFLHEGNNVYNPKLAVKYLQKAMILENKSGKFGYALALFEGKAVNQDKQQSIKIMKELAAEGYQRAIQWLNAVCK